MSELMTVEQLYVDYHKKVEGYIHSRVKNHADAEDLVSDVFAKVVEKIDTFDPSKASYSTWIFTITRNKVIDHFRKFREFDDISELEIADATATALCDGVVLKESVKRLAQALTEMPEKDRSLIVARYYFDRSFRDIGELLGMTEANARVSHGRILKKLRSVLGETICA